MPANKHQDKPLVPIYDQAGVIVDKVVLRKSSSQIPWDDSTALSDADNDDDMMINEGFIDSPSATLPGFRSRSYTSNATSPTGTKRPGVAAAGRLRAVPEDVAEAAGVGQEDSMRSADFGFAASASKGNGHKPPPTLNLDDVADAADDNADNRDDTLRLGFVEDSQDAPAQDGDTPLAPSLPKRPAQPLTLSSGEPSRTGTLRDGDLEGVTCLFDGIGRSVAEQMLAALPAGSYLVRTKPSEGDNVYAVSVKGQGVFVHHLLVLQPDGFLLNGKMQSKQACTLAQALDQLKSEGMPLKHPVESEGVA
eukprot:TRINITY_DN936_c0_g2_i1.p1 TRINITY_DN936_c0_g2~~TRINITY_DN936_c0_g2_i1.p1  ORF type:complete len:321 (+),score=63.32 TRINITY_DN936_c0_g2_i1:44-964(+)